MYLYLRSMKYSHVIQIISLIYRSLLLGIDWTSTLVADV